MATPPDPGAVSVWVLLGARHGDNQQLLAIADALGVPYRTVRLRFNAAAGLPPVLLGPSRLSWRSKDPATLQPPWPRVVLAAGTYGSPAILLRTGIGPAHDLAVLGLPCRSDLPGVGANLQEHPGISVIWPLAEELPDGPRFQVVATQGSPGRAAGDGPWLQHMPAGTPTMFWISATVMNPRSRGRVRLSTLDPLRSPRITLNLLAEIEDLAAMMEGVRSARHVGTRGPLKDLAGGPEQWLGAGADEPAKLADALRRAVWTYHHACGTCAMGPDPQVGAVVDPHGRVYGIDGLWVADASIMPVIPTANTHLPTLMIAERMAGEIAAAD